MYQYLKVGRKGQNFDAGIGKMVYSSKIIRFRSAISGKKVCVSIQGVLANFKTIFRKEYSSYDKLRFMMMYPQPIEIIADKKY